MRRFAALGLVALIGSCVASAVFAAPASSVSVPSGAGVRGDFNGDGRADLAIGAPGPRTSLNPPTGELNVIYGSGHGLSATTVPDQLWTQDSPDVEGTAEPGDRFGLAAAAGDFNADGLADLAIGAPGDSVGSDDSAGAVNVLYGSAFGLSATAVLADQLWNQDSPGVNGVAEPFDAFGGALTTGDFNGDGFADLAIGVEGEGVNGDAGAGAVNVLYGSASGLSPSAVLADQLWTQDSTDVNGNAAAGDSFGSSLVAGDFDGDTISDLAIGVPDDGANGHADAGVVNVLYGSPSGLSATARPDQIWNQDTSNVDGSAATGDLFAIALAAGDFNHDSRADLAIGVPNDDVGGIEAGGVNIIYGSASGLSATTVPDQLWNQEVPGIGGTAELGDLFGWSLVAGDFDGGADDLAIGARGDSFGGTAEVQSGALNVLYGGAAGLSTTGSTYWAQGQGGLLDQAENGDQFGEAVTAADYNGDGRDDLAVSAPFEVVSALDSAGAVSVLYARSGGIAATKNQLWTQDTTDVEGTAAAGDEFGAGLG